MLGADAADTSGMSPEAAAGRGAVRSCGQDIGGQAANIFTSGQYFGGLFVLLLGILLITNEYYHQTATATFLTTPHRTKVIVAKLITARPVRRAVLAHHDGDQPAGRRDLLPGQGSGQPAR